MTTKQSENRIKKLKTIESQLEELTARAEAIKAELKADMEEKGLDEVETPNYTMRWKEIVSRWTRSVLSRASSACVSSRLDNKALTAALPEIAAMYSRRTVTKRFTVA